MNIPERIKIGGFDWSIKSDANVTYEGQIHGSTHNQTQTIFLDQDGTQQKREQTLLHEIMHAIWWQSGLVKRFTDHKMEEEVIDALSNGLYQVLKDNDISK